MLLAFGERLVRPVAALTAAAAASVTAFAIATSTADCVTRVALAAAAGGVAALLALCLLRKGLLLVGAAGFGTVAHYLYEALPPIPGLAPTAAYACCSARRRPRGRSPRGGSRTTSCG